jgi:hypothetical protein
MPAAIVLAGNKHRTELAPQKQNRDVPSCVSAAGSGRRSMRLVAVTRRPFYSRGLLTSFLATPNNENVPLNMVGPGMEASRRSTLAEFSKFHLESVKLAKPEKTEQGSDSLSPTSVPDLPESGFARQVVSGMLKFRGG